MKNLLKSVMLLAIVAIAITSCDKTPENEPKVVTEARLYHIAIGLGDDGNGGTIVQSSDDLTKGKLSFKGFGFEIPSKRTAKVFASTDGKALYALNYGGGELYKYSATGGQDYKEESVINVKPVLGTGHCRQTKISDKEFLVYDVKRNHKYKDAEKKNYDYSESTIVISLVDLDGKMKMNPKSELEIPRSEEDIRENLSIWRMDAAVVHGGKAYIGVAKNSYNPLTDKGEYKECAATTLVLDYPSLKNPKTISSGIAKGETYGYRMTPTHVDENGDIYQVSYGSGHITRIRNEKYDDSFNFKLSDKLGIEKADALGWFYAGNGIGYVPFYDGATGKDSKPTTEWGVARVDLRKGTAIKMNIPGKLWLRQYQKSVTGPDGKFYMALAPIGEKGNIYIFDPKSESADGFTLGAELEGRGGQFYIGIY